MNPILGLSGCAQGRLIAEHAISSVDLIEAHLDRIAEVNPSLNAVIEVLAASAREAARDSDQRTAHGQRIGPLDGVPFSVKDSIEVAGTVCSAGTLGYRKAPKSKSDATLVHRLRAAGAIPIARTNLPDLLFAFESDNLIFGRTNNPYDLTRTSGGSSGGESALIAASGSPFGLGSDAAGSVRLPAHFCGIAALKPTSGRLARTGHVPPAGGWLETVWQIGPMARRVEDLIAMMPILLGPDPGDYTVVDMPWHDPAAFDRRKARVAFFTDNGIATPTSATKKAVRAAAAMLEDNGVFVEEILPPGIEQSYDLEMKMIGPDGADGLREFLHSIGSRQVHPLLEGWLGKEEQYRTTVAGFAGYWAELDRLRSGMHRFLQNYDAILSPVCANPAVPHGTSTDPDIFPGFSYTMTYNVTGLPAAVVRGGESSEGLPICVQIASRPWREDVALALALLLEKTLGGWRPPAISATS